MKRLVVTAMDMHEYESLNFYNQMETAFDPSGGRDGQDLELIRRLKEETDIDDNYIELMYKNTYLWNNMKYRVVEKDNEINIFYTIDSFAKYLLRQDKDNKKPIDYYIDLIYSKLDEYDLYDKTKQIIYEFRDIYIYI